MTSEPNSNLGHCQEIWPRDEAEFLTYTGFFAQTIWPVKH